MRNRNGGVESISSWIPGKRTRVSFEQNTDLRSLAETKRESFSYSFYKNKKYYEEDFNIVNISV